MGSRDIFQARLIEETIPTATLRLVSLRYRSAGQNSIP